jgi:CRP-like cAMP-binding protein
MATQLPEQGLRENRLLAALPRDEYERLVLHSQLIRLPRNRILYEAGDALPYAYFPNSGMASLLAITEDGSTIEIGTVGSEGYIGGSILHQVGMTAYRVTVQIPMMALRMEAKGFLFDLRIWPSLRTVMRDSANAT